MKRRLVVLLASIVVVLLVAAGGVTWWWHWDTDRQPHVQTVVAAMDTALADTVTAAGGEAVVAIGPVVPSAQCKLGLLHTGHEFTAKADLYTDPGGEDALITSIQQKLPLTYAGSRGPAVAGVRALHARAGAVTVAVERVSPGWLVVDARSACSLGTAPPPDRNPPDTTRLAGLLSALGRRIATASETRVPCPSGALITVSASTENGDTSNLATRLAGAIPATAHRIAAGDANRVTYRDGATSIVIAASDDGLSITAQDTTSC